MFLMMKLQVVQEYERAVIFRLGRLLRGGAKGPGKWNQCDFISFFFFFVLAFSYSLIYT